jgi:hypothetical protein
MSGLRGRALEIDDPLGPGPSKRKQPPPVEPGARQTPAARDDQPAGRRKTGRPFAGSNSEPTATATSRTLAVSEEQDGTQHRTDTGAGPWREWSGVTGVGSFPLPHELLRELGDTARELQLPVGLIVTAAITRLLDQPPDTIAALVDHADDARIRARRRARRRLTTRTDE